MVHFLSSQDNINKMEWYNHPHEYYDISPSLFLTTENVPDNPITMIMIHHNVNNFGCTALHLNIIRLNSYLQWKQTWDDEITRVQPLWYNRDQSKWDANDDVTHSIDSIIVIIVWTPLSERIQCKNSNNRKQKRRKTERHI